MSRKIATAAAVFAACDRLDASAAAWNRDDVRAAVGGGGFNVIDPLIQAWRKLQPVRDMAPHTPAELLHRIASSLDTHLDEYLAGVTQREADRQGVFNTTVAELSERSSLLETDLDRALAANAALEQTLLQKEIRIGALTDTLHEKDIAHEKLQTESDTLRGQLQRLEQQWRDTTTAHEQAIKTLDNQHRQQLASLSEEHRHALEQQKCELVQANEASENRWLQLLDRERIEAKTHSVELTKRIEELQSTERQLRDGHIELTAQNQSLRNTSVAELERHMALAEELRLLRANAVGHAEISVLTSSLLALQERLSTVAQESASRKPNT